MLDPVLLLFARILPATLVFYGIVAVILHKLRFGSVPVAVGFVAAWILTALVGLLIAPEPTVDGAGQVVVPAALISALAVSAGIAIRGRRWSRDDIATRATVAAKDSQIDSHESRGGVTSLTVSSGPPRKIYIGSVLLTVAVLAHASFFTWGMGWTHYSMYKSEIRDQRPQERNPQLFVQLGESKFSDAPRYRGYRRGFGLFFREFVASQAMKLSAIVVGLIGSVITAAVGIYFIMLGRKKA